MSMDNAPCKATKEPVVLLSRLKQFNKPVLSSNYLTHLGQSSLCLRSPVCYDLTKNTTWMRTASLTCIPLPWEHTSAVQIAACCVVT